MHKIQYTSHLSDPLLTDRTKALLGLDRAEREDQDSEVDQLDDGDDRGATGRGGARKGPLGDWEAIGWMAAKWCRRAPGVEFMYVSPARMIITLPSNDTLPGGTALKTGTGRLIPP
jgi:hypothetical protein